MSAGAIFLLHEGIQFCIFASYTLLCQTPVCQTAPLLPSAKEQQNLMKYCQEGSISTVIVPTSTSDTEVQHNKKQDALLSEQPSQTPTRNKN